MFFSNASEKYSQRTDSRAVKAYFGSTIATFKREKDVDMKVRAYSQPMPAETRYMREVMAKKASSINKMSQNLGREIMKTHGLTLSEVLWKTHIVS